MIEIVTKENIAEYEQFVENHPQGSYMQSSRWAKQKPDWEWHGFIRRNRRGYITGTLGVLCRKMPVLPRTLIYGPHGPVCDPSDRETIYELIDAARKLGRRELTYLVRLDPSMQEIARPVFEARGFRGRSGRAYRVDRTRRVWQIPLEGRLPENVMDTYLDEHRHRVQIALKRGVEVRFGGKELVAAFSHLMELDSLREGHVVRPLEYYAGLLENFGDLAKIFVAEYEGRTACAALVLRYGRKTVCIHEADDGDINLRARYLLRTAILQQAIEEGCTDCEFLDVPRDPDTEEYAFVSGFGGWLTNYVGTLERVERPLSSLFADLFDAISSRVKKWLYFLRVR